MTKRSEACHRSAKEEWIAAWLTLLAMATSIRDLVAGRLDDWLPERGVGGECLGQILRRRAHRNERDGVQLLLDVRLCQHLGGSGAQLLCELRLASRGQPHAVPAVRHDIYARLLQGRRISLAARACR